MTPHPSLFSNADIDYPIYNLNLSFSDYITQSRSLIASSRLDLTPSNREKIIEANSPFELCPIKPTKRGILLIHGLLDTPSSLKDIGQHYQSEGFLVKAILLPGHGTVPGHLLSVHYEQWQQAVHYGVTSLSREVDDIFLLGVSTGATLSLLYANQHPGRIRGLLLLSPAIQIRSSLARYTQWLSQYITWFHKDSLETVNPAKYGSLPFKAINQVYQLTQLLKNNPPPRVPVFYCISQDDATISVKACLDYFKKDRQPSSRLLLYASQPIILDDPRTTVRSSVYPAVHIRHFSHIGIHVPSSAPQDQSIVQGEFSEPSIYLHNLLFKLRLSQYLYQRLSFNPDFNEMLRQMDAFMLPFSLHVFNSTHSSAQKQPL